MTKKLHLNEDDDESKLKSELIVEFQCSWPAALVLRHEDVRTSGIPDITVNAEARTAWVEAKVFRKGFKWLGQQELTCMRLEAAAFACWVLIWMPTRTLIVRPRLTREWADGGSGLHLATFGIADHRATVNWMKERIINV